MIISQGEGEIGGKDQQSLRKKEASKVAPLAG